MAIWDIKERNKLVRGNDIRKSRVIFAGGGSPNQNIIDFITLTSAGDATDFGDIGTVGAKVGGSSTTRAIFATGYVSPAWRSEFDSVEMDSKGNTIEFGDSTVETGNRSASSNNTRMVLGGGDPGSTFLNVVEYVNIATFGDAADFGDLSAVRSSMYEMPSTPTRGFFVGGDSPSGGTRIDVIEYITYASLGNATDFGNLSSATYRWAGTSSTTRAVLAGGRTPSITNKMETFEMTTLGDGTDFGDLTGVRAYMGTSSDAIRAVWGGGLTPTVSNVIDYIQIAALGNATDFGDLTSARYLAGGASGGHGGIDQDTIQRPSVTYMPGSGRALFGGGLTPSSSGSIEYMQISTLGNGVDFGDMIGTNRHGSQGTSSITRAVIFGGGTNPSVIDSIDTVEIRSLGNCSDFGNLTVVKRSGAAAGSPTRAINAGGSTTGGNYDDVIDYVTIASVGNATDFGDMTVDHDSGAGLGSSTRMVIMGGIEPSDIRLKTNIEFIGKSISGINIYTFNYIDKKGRYEGVMAQEVPWASIKDENGYLKVDYSKIDAKFKRLN